MLTLRELIDGLNGLLADGVDPATEVHIAYNYGDYWKTTVAPKARSYDMELVTHSAYHDMDKIAELDEDGNAPNENYRMVVVIR